jgi:signal transduction histidine kinase
MEASDQPTTAAPSAQATLDQVLRTLGIALWEAWDKSGELITLQGGGSRTERVFALHPYQSRPGARWTENVYPPDRRRLELYLQNTDAADPRSSVDYRLILGDGELLWVRHWLVSRSTDPHRRGRARVRGLIMAIPEQKHLEWECLRVSERECNRIGQELHDDLCQVLAGVNLMMRMLGQRAAIVAPAIAPEIDELNTHVRSATDRVRSMAHGLFPAQLNYGTLRHALKEFARQTQTRFPIELSLDLPRKLPQHSPEQIIQVYRIAQEAVSNAIRHGQATAIRLAVRTSSGGVHLQVEDNGKGLPAASARPEGIGMHVMQYRARMLGGTLHFRNVAPHGAAALLEYPTARFHPRRNHKPVNPL